MLKKTAAALAALLVMVPAMAQAAPEETPPLAASVAPPSVAAQPDLLSFGVGYFDVRHRDPHKESVDFRLEHRWGNSLLPKIDSSLSSLDRYIQVHPMVGLEGTSNGSIYTPMGFVFDIPLGDHVVLSPNETVGFYYRGDGKRLGSFVEFRSTMELGWRFNDESRLTVSFGHISNAGLTNLNPGAEMGNVYYHVPVSAIFGN